MTINDLIQKLIMGEITLSQSMMLTKVYYKESLCEQSFKWLCDELEHYEDPQLLPDYRIINCKVKVMISCYGRTWTETLDTSYFDRILGENATASPNKMLVCQGIESIEKTLCNAGKFVEMELHRGQVDLMLKYYTLSPGYRIEKMYQECRVENVQNIVSCVRNKLITILQNVVSTQSPSHLPSDLDCTKKRVFISYGWDDTTHCKWVHSLARRLSEFFDVIIDEKTPLGTDLNAFMEQQITKATRVLLILTPMYKEKADKRQNGVGYESVLISSELYYNQDSTKFIPIIRRGTIKEAYPSYLGNRKGIIMTDDTLYEESINQLVDDIKNN